MKRKEDWIWKFAPAKKDISLWAEGMTVLNNTLYRQNKEMQEFPAGRLYLLILISLNRRNTNLFKSDCKWEFHIWNVYIFMLNLYWLILLHFLWQLFSAAKQALWTFKILCIALHFKICNDIGSNFNT